MSSKKLTSSQRRPRRGQATVKEAALEVLRDLPSDCTWEQVIDCMKKYLPSSSNDPGSQDRHCQG